LSWGSALRYKGTRNQKLKINPASAGSYARTLREIKKLNNAFSSTLRQGSVQAGSL
jgi:hypothetical protein